MNPFLRSDPEESAIQHFANHMARTAMANFEWHLEVFIEQAMDEYTQDHYAIVTA